MYLLKRLYRAMTTRCLEIVLEELFGPRTRLEGMIPQTNRKRLRQIRMVVRSMRRADEALLLVDRLAERIYPDTTILRRATNRLNREDPTKNMGVVYPSQLVARGESTLGLIFGLPILKPKSRSQLEVPLQFWNYVLSLLVESLERQWIGSLWISALARCTDGILDWLQVFEQQIHFILPDDIYEYCRIVTPILTTQLKLQQQDHQSQPSLIQQRRSSMLRVLQSLSRLITFCGPDYHRSIVWGTRMDSADAIYVADHVLLGGFVGTLMAVEPYDAVLICGSELPTILANSLQLVMEYGDPDNAKLKACVQALRSEMLEAKLLSFLGTKMREWFKVLSSHGDGRHCVAEMQPVVELQSVLAKAKLSLGDGLDFVNLFSIMNVLYQRMEILMRPNPKTGARGALEAALCHDKLELSSTTLFISQTWELFGHLVLGLADISPSDTQPEDAPLQSGDLALEEICALIEARVGIPDSDMMEYVLTILDGLLNLPPTILVWQWESFFVWYRTGGAFMSSASMRVDLRDELLDEMITLFFDIRSKCPSAMAYYVCPYNPLPETLPKKNQSWPLLKAESHPYYKLLYFVSIMMFLDQTDRVDTCNIQSIRRLRCVRQWLAILPEMIDWVLSLENYVDLVHFAQYNAFFYHACSLLTTFETDEGVSTMMEKLMASYPAFWRSRVTSDPDVCIEIPNLLLKLFVNAAFAHKDKRLISRLPSPFLEFGRLILAIGRSAVEEGKLHLENDEADIDEDECYRYMEEFHRALCLFRVFHPRCGSVLSTAGYFEMFWETGVQTYWRLHAVCSASNLLDPLTGKAWDKKVSDFLCRFRPLARLPDSALHQTMRKMTECWLGARQELDSIWEFYSSSWSAKKLRLRRAAAEADCDQWEDYIAVKKEIARRSQQTRNEMNGAEIGKPEKQNALEVCRVVSKPESLDTKLDAAAEAKEAAKKAKKLAKRARQKAIKAAAAEEGKNDDLEDSGATDGQALQIPMDAPDSQRIHRSALAAPYGSSEVNDQTKQPDEATAMPLSDIQEPQLARQLSSEILKGKFEPGEISARHNEQAEIRDDESELVSESSRNAKPHIKKENADGNAGSNPEGSSNTQTQTSNLQSSRLGSAPAVRQMNARTHDSQATQSADHFPTAGCEASFDDSFWQQISRKRTRKSQKKGAPTDNCTKSCGGRETSQSQSNKLKTAQRALKPRKVATQRLEDAVNKGQNSQGTAGTGPTPANTQSVPARPVTSHVSLARQLARPTPPKPPVSPDLNHSAVQLMANEGFPVKRPGQIELEIHCQPDGSAYESLLRSALAQSQAAPDRSNSPGRLPAKLPELASQTPPKETAALQAQTASRQDQHVLDAQPRQGLVCNSNRLLPEDGPTAGSKTATPLCVLPAQRDFVGQKRAPSLPSQKRPASHKVSESRQRQTLEDFCTCPITQEIMEDPVVAKDGFTYERAAIAAWLQEHNTSPMTNTTLVSKELQPILLVRQMVIALRARASGSMLSPS